MHERLLSALLRKLADEPANDAHDPWPAIRDRLTPTGIPALHVQTTEREGRESTRVASRPPRRVRRTITGSMAAATIVAILSVAMLQPWNRPSSANAAGILQGIRDEAFTMASPAGPSDEIAMTPGCLPAGAVSVAAGGALLPPPPGGAIMHLDGQPGGSMTGLLPDVTPGAVFNVTTGGPIGQTGFRPAMPCSAARPDTGSDGPVIAGRSGGPPNPNATPGALFFFRAGPNQGAAGVSEPQELQPPNPTELSDRLGQALGLSGDRVRDAMRQTISADLPPSDPLNRVASQLGVSREQIRDAFSDPSCPGTFMIKLHASAADLSGPAAKLGISADLLAAALAAAAPPMPPSIDDTINRLAQNLGVSGDQLRSALTQIEGPNQFYLAIPAPPGQVSPSLAITPVPVLTSVPTSPGKMTR